ncbi:MAG: hypothetical protein CVV08_00740 [Gammaproteobacteria bacterium HGW-Gammaproteobacteria-12]|nr:MAG: hypothetical protein CVV08_00740 [Gammaproteobacteria bacterium HGW-Gammaproteobacteria-12]
MRYFRMENWRYVDSLKLVKFSGQLTALTFLARVFHYIHSMFKQSTSTITATNSAMTMANHTPDNWLKPFTSLTRDWLKPAP